MRSFESLDAKEKGMLAASSAMEYLKMNQDDSIRYPRPTVPTRTVWNEVSFRRGLRASSACLHPRATTGGALLRRCRNTHQTNRAPAHLKQNR